MERLDTTNVLLGVLAFASLAHALLLAVLAYGAYRAVRSASHLVDARLLPSLSRLEGVLANLERTSHVVQHNADDVARALTAVGNVATRVSAVMWPRTTLAASVAGGVLGAVRRWRRGGRPDAHAPASDRATATEAAESIRR